MIIPISEHRLRAFRTGSGIVWERTVPHAPVRTDTLTGTQVNFTLRYTPQTLIVVVRRHQVQKGLSRLRIVKEFRVDAPRFSPDGVGPVGQILRAHPGHARPYFGDWIVGPSGHGCEVEGAVGVGQGGSPRAFVGSDGSI
jgi:hypothetical protein